MKCAVFQTCVLAVASLGDHVEQVEVIPDFVCEDLPKLQSINIGGCDELGMNVGPLLSDLRRYSPTAPGACLVVDHVCYHMGAGSTWLECVSSYETQKGLRLVFLDNETY